MSTHQVNGITLHAEQAGDGPPLLLLHGFTGSAATWRPLAERLAPLRRTIAVDLIGHGESDAPADPARYTAERCVADLLALLDSLGADPFDLLGYSLGGRLALQLAAAAPERVARLVLESSTAGIADPAERQARAAADDALAEAIERDGLEAFVDRWERLPLWASQAALPAALRERLRAQRLRNRPLGLAGSLRGMGAGRPAPLWDRLPGLSMPALVLAGALDEKYCALARQIAAAMPRAQLAIIPGAGHAIHLERPDVFIDRVVAFLEAEQFD